jgi:predicted transcriptional regulator
MRKKEIKQKQMSFVLPPDEIAVVERIARTRDVSVSWFIRQAIRAALAEHHKSAA